MPVTCPLTSLTSYLWSYCIQRGLGISSRVNRYPSKGLRHAYTTRGLYDSSSMSIPALRNRVWCFLGQLGRVSDIHGRKRYLDRPQGRLELPECLSIDPNFRSKSAWRSESSRTLWRVAAPSREPHDRMLCPRAYCILAVFRRVLRLSCVQCPKNKIASLLFI